MAKYLFSHLFILKMRDKLLYEVAEAIVGKSGREIVELLKDKRDVNEFKIAEKLKITINQARNILYKLYAQDIVSFIRKKDKSKGWYIYYWTLNILKSLELLTKIKQKELHEQQNLLKSKENKSFYHCKQCSVELTEETALNHDFLCPECGSLLEASDNRDKVIEITKKINKIENEIAMIQHEMQKLRGELEKKYIKKEIAEKKKKGRKRVMKKRQKKAPKKSRRKKAKRVKKAFKKKK